ncbi:MAG: hypothetical protein U1F76_32285 [Candidatus Competibacteraceae bacterium]
MNKQDLSRDEQLALWKLVLQRLELMSVPAPLSREAAREILASWLPRWGHETLGERIRWAEAVRFEPLTEIVRLAADSGPELPLPDPGRPLETVDGCFRLTVTAEADQLLLQVEALGFAMDEFANQRIGIARRGEWYTSEATPVTLPAEALVAIIALNADGEGQCRIVDRPEVRAALLRPVIGLIKD